MVGIPNSVRTLVAEGHLAHLVTVNAARSPQVSIVWMGIDGDELVSGHLREHLKVRNLRRDPRAVISMESEVVETNGLQQHLIAHCTARVTEGGAPELLQALAHVYLGPDVKFPAHRQPAARLRPPLQRRPHRRCWAVGSLTSFSSGPDSHRNLFVRKRTQNAVALRAQPTARAARRVASEPRLTVATVQVLAWCARCGGASTS